VEDSDEWRTVSMVQSTVRMAQWIVQETVRGSGGQLRAVEDRDEWRTVRTEVLYL
jgi:hypothetical protein